MITDKKLRHILGVARRCYEIAKERGYCEYVARKYWLVGYLHDIGYEFTDISREHPQVGNEIIKSLFDKESFAVLYHGDPDHTSDKNLSLDILNIADLTVDTDGNKCNVFTRLEDIKYRYGESSREYNNALKVAKDYNLIDNS